MATDSGSFLDPRKLTIDEWADILREEVGTVITTEEFKLQHGEHFAPWNTEASRDTILHLVDGLGDVNPLYRDEAYAETTRYGALVAPPSFLYTVWYPTGTFMRKMVQGFSGFNSGGAMEWLKHARREDDADPRPGGLLQPARGAGRGGNGLQHQSGDPELSRE
jgi:hypothetical protein